MNKKELQILKMFVDGATYQFIGDKFNLTRERIRVIIKNNLEDYQIKELIKANREKRKCFTQQSQAIKTQ